ncbi:MAG: MBL fold metallo-hydrolase [Bryobacteraceae bacterium]|jgi:7,8-dihydropterin-6-yl-methyl-4-(beta-D-ribofuranosyl)aminobenzene 5'-phosphate synthase
MTARIALLGLLSLASCTAADKVASLEVRLLSTMLTADEGYGEWGFAALVVADGHRILFDTGAHPNTVLDNARALGIDLSNVPDVILSHHHLDHTAGLVTLRSAYAKSNPAALARAHAGEGIFRSRTDDGTGEANTMIATRRDYESAGGTFVMYGEPRELFPGVWLTGPVPRKYPEKNWGRGRKLRLADGATVEDNLPEDQSLVVVTEKGLVVISGCGHAGIVNTLEYARAKIAPAPVYAALGGFHLYQASDDTLAWTASKLKEFGLQNLLGAHCTGIEAVYRLRQLIGLDRKTAAVGAVGGGFTLSGGLDPGSIAR